MISCLAASIRCRDGNVYGGEPDGNGLLAAQKGLPQPRKEKPRPGKSGLVAAGLTMGRKLARAAVLNPRVVTQL